MLRVLKFCGALIFNAFVALIGTAVLETSVGKAFRPHSLAAILWKEWSLSLLCAVFIGFFMWRTWRMCASKWTWILPGVWFGLRFVQVAIFVRGGIWSQFSGTDCDNGVHAFGCRNFFVFTIPFIRGVAYSVGAFVSSLLAPPELQSATESSKLVPTPPPTAR
jgi:hypothetical protein